jgi:hypothetical protein
VAQLVNRAVTTDPDVQQMPSVAVNPLDSNHVVVAYMDYALRETGFAGIGVAVSRDGGRPQHTAVPLPQGFDEKRPTPSRDLMIRGRSSLASWRPPSWDPKPPLTHPDFVNPERNASDREYGFQANNGVFVREVMTELDMERVGGGGCGSV